MKCIIKYIALKAWGKMQRVLEGLAVGLLALVIAGLLVSGAFLLIFAANSRVMIAILAPIFLLISIVHFLARGLYWLRVQYRDAKEAQNVLP